MDKLDSLILAYWSTSKAIKEIIDAINILGTNHDYPKSVLDFELYLKNRELDKIKYEMETMQL